MIRPHITLLESSLPLSVSDNDNDESDDDDNGDDADDDERVARVAGV